MKSFRHSVMSPASCSLICLLIQVRASSLDWAGCWKVILARLSVCLFIDIFVRPLVPLNEKLVRGEAVGEQSQWEVESLNATSKPLPRCLDNPQFERPMKHQSLWWIQRPHASLLIIHGFQRHTSSTSNPKGGVQVQWVMSVGNGRCIQLSRGRLSCTGPYRQLHQTGKSPPSVANGANFLSWVAACSSNSHSQVRPI